MGIFKKKPVAPIIEVKCMAEGCSFTCHDQVTLQKHREWKHPEASKNAAKAK